VLHSEPPSQGGVLAPGGPSSGGPDVAKGERIGTSGVPNEGGQPSAAQVAARTASHADTTIDPLPAAKRAEILLHHLELIKSSAVLDQETQRYVLLPVGVEGWLQTAIAAAQQLVEELGGHVPGTPEGDAPDPGGEHGGVAD
jgi:hypothetical protein